MKPLVFISSVSRGFGQIRQSAKKAIEKTGGKPIGFEDFPALNQSSRNACLDGVADSDIYLGIFGAQYGYVSPSGFSATEEEFNEAVRLGKPRLIFVQEVEQREPKQQAFLDRVGDYRTGRFWQKFDGHDDLPEKLEPALKEVFKRIMHELSPLEIREKLINEIETMLDNLHDQSWLVTTAHPTCQMQLVDDIDFNNQILAQQIFMLGMEGKYLVFEIELAKSKTLKKDHWLLEQIEHQNWHDGQRLTLVKFYLNGCVVLSMNVTGREPESHDSMNRLFYIIPDKVKEIAHAQTLFLRRLYDHFDPHIRWDKIGLMSALHNIKNRNFAEPKPGQTSHSMPFRSLGEYVLAFDDPKILERQQLENKEYAQALVASFHRQIK